jgi:hypothetical protein
MGPFSKHVISQIERKIEGLGAGALDPHVMDNAGQVEAAVL